MSNIDKTEILNETREQFWDKFKEENGRFTFSSSEDILGITRPPDHQCPSIDIIISGLTEIQSLINQSQYQDDSEDLQEYISKIEYELSGLEDKVESVRAAVETVRDWGQQWKDQYKDLLYSIRNEVDIEDHI